MDGKENWFKACQDAEDVKQLNIIIAKHLENGELRLVPKVSKKNEPLTSDV